MKALIATLLLVTAIGCSTYGDGAVMVSPSISAGDRARSDAETALAKAICSANHEKRP
jgi:hypothetical protein